MGDASDPRSPSGAPSRWTDRGLGAAIGVAVTAIVLWPDDPTPPDTVTPPTTAAAIRSESTAPVEPNDVPTPTPTPVPPAVARPDATSTDTTGPFANAAADSDAAETTDGDIADDATTAAAPTVDHGDAPEIPITPLPGSKFLRRSAEFDDDKNAWVLIQTVRVVAPAYQVQGYYEKALEEAGIRVRAVQEPPNDKFKHRATINGRAGGNVVQISVRQEAAQMRTTARIIWRVDADGRIKG